MVAPTSGATKKRRRKPAAGPNDSSRLEAIVDADVIVVRPTIKQTAIVPIPEKTVSEP